MRLHSYALALTALVTCSSLGAQGNSERLSFGLIGGLNLSTINGDFTQLAENRAGFSVGGFLRKPISGVLDFQIEGQYSVKGTKFSGLGATATLNLSYFEIPVLLRASAKSNDSFHPFVEGGGAVGLNSSCSFSAGVGSFSGSLSCSGSGASVKSFDAGLVGGAGIEIPVGTNAVGIGVRYTFGLVSVFDQGSIKNRNLQFLASIRF